MSCRTAVCLADPDALVCTLVAAAVVALLAWAIHWLTKKHDRRRR